MCSNLGGALRAAWTARRSVAYLDEAIPVLREAFERTPPGDRLAAVRLATLVEVMDERMDAGTDATALDRLIDCREALLRHRLDGADHVGLHLDLGRMYTRRYHLRRDVRDLERAVTVDRVALDTAVKPADQARCHFALAVDWHDWYRRDAALDALDNAHRHAQLAADLDPSTPGRATALWLLGGCHEDRFTLSGSDDALFRARDAYRLALALTPDDSDERPQRQTDLGVCLIDAAHRTCDAALVDEGIELIESARAILVARR